MILSSWLAGLRPTNSRAPRGRNVAVTGPIEYVPIERPKRRFALSPLKLAPCVEVFEMRTLLTTTTFTVNTTLDAVDANLGDGIPDTDLGTPGLQTSLRAAIQEANQLSDEFVEIIIPAGTYNLTIASTGGGTAATGDLEINNANSEILIRGAGQGLTIVDAIANSTRVFDIEAAALSVTIGELSLRGSSSGDGGAVSTNSNLTLDSVTIENSASNGRGGALHVGTGASATVLVSVFQNNAANGDGGAIRSDGDLTVIGSIFSDNSSGMDGGHLATGTSGFSTIIASTFAGNAISTNAINGGAISVNGGEFSLDGVEISGNVASGAGGGLEAKGGATVHVARSTISANSAGSTGGGIQNSTANVTLNNVTVSSNTAASTGSAGAGIYNDISSSLDLNHSTIAGNNAAGGSGGGVSNIGGGTVIVTNTIIGDNSAAGSNPDVDGDFQSSFDNLIETVGTATGFSNEVGDILGSDPRLLALGDNGGPTPTHALDTTPGMESPAIDGGTAFAFFGGIPIPETDQRGVPRNIGLAPDIGAFETGFGGFIVDTMLDTNDQLPGDGVAADATGNTSLRAAVQEVNAGGGTGEIVIPPGFYQLTRTGEGPEGDSVASDFADLDILNNASLIGFDPSSTVVDGGGIGRVIQVAAGTVDISGVTLQNGDAGTTNGGGLLNSGQTRLINVRILNNQAVDGGGIASDSDLELHGVLIADNMASGDGGGAAIQADAAIFQSTITDNVAQGDSGGLGVDGTVELVNSTVRENTAMNDAGGIGVDLSAMLTAVDSTVTLNTATNRAGGIGSQGTTSLVRTSVTSNTAGTVGGGIAAEAGLLSVAGSTIASNTAGISGGGITLQDLMMGPGPLRVDIEFSEVAANQAPHGAGLDIFGADVTISHSTIAENVATMTGAGLRLDSGSAAIDNSTIAANTAMGNGGGLLNAGGTASLTNVTVASNTADQGGGLASFGAANTSVANSILAANTATLGINPDVFADSAFRSLGSNLVGVGGFGFSDGVNGDQAGTAGGPLDPMLDVLKLNGGQTRTMTLQPGSPALDAGDDAFATETDQRGATRQLNSQSPGTAGQVDIGAFEAGFTGFFVNTTEDTQDNNPGDGMAQDSFGNTSLRAAIQEANATVGAVTIVLPAGEYSLTQSGADEDNAATGDLDITTNNRLLILGAGSEITTIDGAGLDRVLDLRPGVDVGISDVSIINGHAETSNGGGIRMEGAHLDLDRATLRDNVADLDGGAIHTFNSFATLIITDSLIEENSANFAGAISAADDSVSISGSLIRRNTAATSVGAIYVSGNPFTLLNSEVSENVAMTGEAGGILLDFTTGQITGSRISQNIAGTNAGGLALDSSTATITGSEILANMANNGDGGGVRVVDGNLTVDSSRIQDNSANFGPNGGGGISIEITGSGILTVSDSVFIGNSDSSTGGGGGGLFTNATAEITGSTFEGNFATNNGGGIFAEGEFTLTNSTLSGNQTGTEGGGLYVAGAGTSAVIVNSTITQNRSFAVGGGVVVAPTGSPDVDVENTIIAQNIGDNAAADVDGSFTSSGNNLIGDLDLATGFIDGINGDIVGGDSSVTVTDASNAEPIVITATAHGFSTGDTVRVGSVEGNEAANGVFEITVLDANLFELNDSIGSGTYAAGGSVLRLVNPLLGPLQNNTIPEDVTPRMGGASELGLLVTSVDPVVAETHALLPGSPAIDAGNNDVLPLTDQRGIVRPVDGDGNMAATVDIGAVELFYTTVSGIVFDDTNGNGLVDPGEFELTGVTVYFDSNQNGQFDSGEPNAISGNMSAGDFTLTLVPPGDGNIDVVLPSNSRRTSLNPIVFSSPLAIHTDPGADFAGSVAGDFDQDGDLDLAVTSVASNEVTVLLSGEGGQFDATQYPTSGTGTSDVVAGDFNGDGFLDLAAMNASSRDVTVFLNDQSGGFVALTPAAVPGGVNLTGITAGDFFGSNGAVDLTVAKADGTVNVLFNDGTGLMGAQAPQGLGAATMPSALVTADLNGDEYVDAIVIGETQNVVIPLMNTMLNLFVPQPITLPNRPLSVVADDFDRDGKVDFAVSMEGAAGVRIYRNVGNGEFVNVQSLPPGDGPTMQSIDVTGDGLPDLVIGRQGLSTLTVFQNQGTSGFIPFGVDVASGEVPNSIAVGDFTGDGRADVVVAGDVSDSVQLLTSLSQTAEVSATTGFPVGGTQLGVQQLGSITGTKFHDLNRDGFQDTGEPGLAGVDVYLDLNGNGRPDLHEPVTTTTGDDPATPGMDETGDYQFNGVVPGDYLVAEIVSPGFSQTSPSSVSFFTRELASSGAEAADVEVLDIDGDGELDLAVTRAPLGMSGSLEIYRGDGNGGFLFVDSATVGNDPFYLTAGDIDADGNVDFVVANTPDGTLSILEFEGGSLQDRTLTAMLPVLPDPTTVRLADLNGDSQLDIVVANGAPSPGSRESVVYLPNQSTGPGSFAFGSLVEIGGDASVVAFDLADLDLDGDLDLVAAEQTMPTSGFRAYRNDSGIFTEVSVFDTGVSPVSLRIADVDANGRLDVVVGASAMGAGEVRVHLSAGDFMWADGGDIYLTGMNPAEMVIDDFNRDGILDIAVTDDANLADGQIQILAGDPIGSFFATGVGFSAGPLPTGLASGDFDGDGATDLVVTNFVAGQNNLRVLMHRQGGQLTTVSGGNTTTDINFGNIAHATVQGRKFHDLDADGVFDAGEPTLEGFTIFADLDGNGQLDPHEPSVVTGLDGMYTLTGIEAGRDVTIREIVPAGWMQTSPRTLSSRETIFVPVGDDPERVAIGDLDGDGDLDTVTVNRGTNTVSVLLLDDMTGEFIRQDFTTGGSGATDLALMDLDGNGSLDVVVSHNTVGSVSILLNNGSGSLGMPTVVSTGAVQRIAVGDFTNDMILDVAITEPTGIRVLAGDGDGGLSSGQAVATSSQPLGIVAADFNGDGVVDLATADSGVDQVSVILNNAGTLQSAVSVSVTPGSAPSGLGAGDFDGDGDVDLLVAASGLAELLTNDGTGVFTAQQLSAFGSEVAIADINGDGNLDAAFRSDFQITFFVGNGAGAFVESEQVNSTSPLGGLAVGDMNNDGRPDLAFTRQLDDFNNGDSTVGFLVNSTGSYTINAAPGATIQDLINLQSVDHLGFSLAPDSTVSNAAGDDISTTVPHIFILGNGANAYELYSFTVENAGDKGFFDLDSGAGPGDDLDSVLYLFDEAGNLLATNDDGDGDPGSSSILDSLLEYTFSTPGIYVIAVANYSNSPLVGPNGITHAPVPAGSNYVLHIAIENHPLGTGVPMSQAPEDVFNGRFDFGNLSLPGSVSGIKFDDLNLDGVQDGGEAGLGGFTIYADLDNSGTLDMGEPSTVTAGDGTWTISGLPGLNEYTIREVQQPGFVQTTPDGLQFSTTGIDSSSPFAITVFDVDGQFGEDLIVTDEFNAQILIYLRQMDGSFGTPTTHAVGADPVKVVAEHLNADANIDLVVVNEGSNNVSVLLGTGSGGFASAVTYGVGLSPVDATLADVGGDGELDLIVANSGQNSFFTLINDGSGGFGPGINTGTGAGTLPTGIAAALIDGDAFVDVVISAEGTDELLVFPGLGGGNFGPATSIALGTGAAPSSVLATDLNGDEAVDLVTTDEGLGRVSVLLGDFATPGQFLTPVTYSVLSFPYPLIEGDFNGDALIDLAVVHDDDDQISVLLGNGDGTLQPALFFDTGAAPGGIAVIDLNGDDRDDLAVTATDEGPGVIELKTSEINVHVVDLEPGENLMGLTFGNTEINDPPVITTPGPQTTVEDTNLEFSSDNLNAITIADPDVGAGVVEVTLSVTLGELSLSTTVGLSFTAGDGSNDSTMTFTGTPGAVNFALEGMTYSPPAGASGSSTLSVQVDDLGNTGAGGANVLSKSVLISITAVNDPPLVSVPGAQTVAEDDSLSFAGVSGNEIVVSDADAAGMSLEVDLSVSEGTLTLSTTTGLSFTGGDGTGDDSMTFRGSASEINAALDGLVYDPDIDFSGSDTLSIQVNDLGNSGDGGPQTVSRSVDITVTGVNDGPAVAVPGTQTTNEDTSLVFNSGNSNSITVSDPDAGTQNLEVELSVSDGVLSLSGTTGLSFGAGDGSNDGTMTFQGKASDINAALDGLIYEPDIDFGGSDLLSIQVDDLGNTGAGGPRTDSKAVNISVNSVNDAPSIQSLSGDTLSYTEGDGPLIIDQGMAAVAADIDSADFNGGALSIAITAGGSPSEDVLGIRDQGAGAGQIGISGSDVLFQGTKIGTFSGGTNGDGLLISFTDAAADPGSVTALLRNITYENTNNGAPDAGNRTLTFVLSDGDGGLNNAIATVGVTAINDAPQVNNLAGDTLSYDEGDGAVVIDQNSVATFVDPDSADLNTGTLTVSVTSGGQSAEDVLAIRNQGTGAGQVGVSGSDVSFEGTVIGTFTGGSNGNNLVVTFNGDSSPAAATALLRNVTYENIDNDDPTAGSRAVRFALTDGDGGSTGNVDVTVDVRRVNDAPVLTVPGSQTVGQQTSLVINGISASDDDAAGADVTLTLSVTNGTLTVSTSAVGGVAAMGLVGNGTDEVTLVAPVAAISATLGDGVIYLGATGFSGTETLTVAIDDGGNSGPGGPLTDSATVTIAVVENATPVLAGIETAVLDYTENDAATQVAATLAVSDADSAQLTGATISISANYQSDQDRLTVDTTGTAIAATGFNVMTGMLTLTGNDSPAAYQQVLRTVRYENTSELPATATRTVSVVVSDELTNSVAATRDITVESVNDVPSFTVGQTTSATIDEHRTNPAAIFTVQVEDLDSAQNDLTFAIVNGNPGNAFAINSSGEITVNDPAAVDFEASPTFGLEVRVTDETLESSSQTFTINLNDLNENFVVPPSAFTGGRVTIVRDGALLRAVDDLGDDVVPAATVTTVLNVVVTGRDEGSDELRVDFSGGIPVPGGVISYDGGTSTDTVGGGDENDSLSLVGGSVSQVNHLFLDANSGDVSVDGFSIDYTGLEPIFDDLTADDRVFTFGDVDDTVSGNAPDSVVLADDDVSSNGVLRIQSAGTSESVDFRVPSNSLRIETNGGDDSVTLLAVDAQFNTLLTIVDAGAGNDIVDALAFVADGQFVSPNTHLIGGDGNDSLIGSSGNDLLEGEDGDDELSGGEGSNTLSGGAGDDLLSHLLFNGMDVADGGTGNDLLQLQSGGRFEVPPDAVTYEFTASENGLFTAEIEEAGQLMTDSVSFTGINEIDENIGAAQTQVDYSALTSVLTLNLMQTGSLPVPDETRLVTPGVTSLILQAVPGNLEVLGGTGNDQFSVVNLPSGFNAGLTFDGLNGSDSFVLTGGLPSGGIVDDLDVTAESIQLEGNIDANSNTIRLNGQTTFAGSTTLTASLVDFAQGVQLDTGDPLTVNGAVDVDGAQLQLIDSLLPTPGNDKLILNNDGVDAVNGTFAGLPEGTVLTATVPSESGEETRAFIISYLGGDGNDVVLQPTAAISGVVWDDVNEDGVRQMGESGVAGVGVRVRLAQNSQILVSTTTAMDGTYSLAGLPAAEVVVEFDSPVGDRFTLRDVGADDTIDSDPHRLTGRTNPILLSAGDMVSSVDAGLARVLVSVADATPINEGQTGDVSTVEFELQLSGRSPRPVTVTARAFEGVDGQPFAAATPGTDFLQFAGGSTTVTFQPGQTSRIVRLPIVGDGLVEPSEAFEIRLSNVTNGAIDDGVALAVIRNDDVQVPTVELAPSSSVVERNFPNRPTLEYTLRLLGGPSNQDILVSYETAPGTSPTGVVEATPGALVTSPNADYLAVAGVARIPAGQESARIQVTVLGDNSVEPNEVVPLRLTGVSAAAGGQVQLGSVTSTLGTIINDDVMLPTVSIGDAEVVELNEPFEPAMRFPVTLDGPSTQTVFVEFSSVILQGPGTGTAFVDYEPRFNGVLEIPAGRVDGFIDIPIFGDQDIESDEVISVEIVSVTNGLLGETLAVGTIVNDDFNTPEVSLRGDAETREGRRNEFRKLEFEVVLNGPAMEDITVVVSTLNPATGGGPTAATPGMIGADGRVTPAGGDFLSFTERSVVIPRGQTSAKVAVELVGDETAESDEQLRIRIDRVEGNATLDPARAQAIGTIRNDDRETVVVSIDPETSVRETDDPKTSVAEVTVRLDAVANEVITVGYRTVDATGMGLATPDVDFVSVGDALGAEGEIVFAPGDIEQTIQVIVLGDRMLESPEDFFIELTSVQGENDAMRVDPVTGVLINPVAELDAFGSRAKATILDNDDGQAVVSIQSTASVLEPDGPGVVPVTLSVSLDNALADDVVVAWSTRSNTQPGHATANVDFDSVTSGTVTIPAGRTTASVSVPIFGDDLQEGDERFLVMLDQVISGSAGISPAELQSEVTIADNDFDRPIVQIADAEVIEGDPGDDVDLVFTIQLAGPVPDRQVSVELTTDRLDEDVSGLARTDGDGRDAFATRRVLYFDPSVTSQEFRVRVVPDDRFEADELVFVRLFNTDGVDLAPGANQAIGRILNDDFPVPTLTIGSATMLEGDAPGQNILEFEVTLDADPEQGGIPTVTVDYDTVDVSALEGVDYEPASGTLTFDENVRSQTIQVPIIGDMTDERTEELIVRLSNAVNATLHPGAFQGLGVIENDDSPNVRLQIDSVMQREGNDGTTDFVFTVTRIGQPTSNVTVNYATASGTALAGLDFQTRSGQLTFTAGGSATQQITVPVIADDLPEDEFKSFFVTLDSPVGATIDPVAPQGTGTILDDDVRVFREDADQELLRIARQIQDLIDQVGNNPDNRELIDLITTLSRDVLRRLNLDAGLVFITDPVDFLLTDVESRTVGYTDSTGEVTEVEKAYYSGDAAVELVVIPGADAGLYGLQLSGVGSGEYRTAATLVTSEGFAKTETSGGVLNGDFELALDLTPGVIVNLQNNVFTELAEAARSNAAEQNMGDVTEVQLAASEEARLALESLRSEIRDAAIIDGRSQPLGGLFGQMLRQVTDFGSQLKDSLADELEELFGNPLDDADPQVGPDADKSDDDDEPDSLDTFWRSLGRNLLGTPGNLMNLSDFFDLTGSNDDAGDGANGSDADNNQQNGQNPDGSNDAAQQNNGQPQPDGNDQASLMPERYRRLRYWPDGRFAQVDDGKVNPWAQPRQAKPVVKEQMRTQGTRTDQETAVRNGQREGVPSKEEVTGDPPAASSESA